MINAGDYNKKISIYQIVVSEDDAGFKTKSKSIILNTYAKVKTTRGFTLIASNTDFEKAYTNFTIRFPRKVEISRDMLIEYNGKTYSIEYLNNVDEKNIELEIQAKVVEK
jgi:SPP1 family predicted phage head-tail adaptor